MTSEGYMEKVYETVNHIMNKCCKLIQSDYKTNHDWMGKGIHWELFKWLKFDHIAELYMYKQDSILKK